MTAGKIIALNIWAFFSKMTSLLFNTLSGFVIALLQGASVFWFHGFSHHPQWVWSPRKSVRASAFPSSICSEVIGPHALILVFWMLSFKPAFSLSSFPLIKRLFSTSSVSAIRVVSSAYLEVVDISSSNLYSILWLIQPCILHDVLCIEVK